MPLATLRFTLPEEESEFRAARLGGAAIALLAAIDQHCRRVVKHGEPSEDVRVELEAIRTMIRDEAGFSLE